MLEIYVIVEIGNLEIFQGNISEGSEKFPVFLNLSEIFPKCPEIYPGLQSLHDC